MWKTSHTNLFLLFKSYTEDDEEQYKSLKTLYIKNWNNKRKKKSLNERIKSDKICQVEDLKKEMRRNNKNLEEKEILVNNNI